MLKKILNKKSITVIGLNAGTSADGLDLAAVKVSVNGKNLKSRFIEGTTVSYSKNIREAVHLAITGKLKTDDIIELDRLLGSFYGRHARKYIEKLNKKNIRTDIVSSHGQTVRHLPGRFKVNRKKASGTMQLGHPESIAELTGHLTIADFRQADIASGGEGAPITSYPMWHLFSDRKVDKLLLNIGGIANYFYLPKKMPAERMKAKDCGPGNSLLDLASEKYFGKQYDSNGRFGSKGKFSKRLLTILLSDSFLKGKFGPSTGRERFGLEFLEKVEKTAKKLKLNKYDILATLTELTAIGIRISLLPILKNSRVTEIDIFGGGARNQFLIDRIEANINKKIKFFKVDRYGLNSDYLEAVCFALLGVMTLHSMPAGLPDISGADGKAICGRIVQPSVK